MLTRVFQCMNDQTATGINGSPDDRVSSRILNLISTLLLWEAAESMAGANKPSENCLDDRFRLLISILSLLKPADAESHEKTTRA